jgi:NADH:ubiquinone oxidoreductase subunit 2 (subunit N)
VNTAISIYYYLNLVRHAYTSEAEQVLPSPRPGSAFWGGVLAVILLLMGAFPEPVFRYAEIAGEQLISNF